MIKHNPLSNAITEQLIAQMKSPLKDIDIAQVRAPRVRGAPPPCNREVMAMLNCFADHEFDMSAGVCHAEVEALRRCKEQLEAAKALKPNTHKPTTNFHLQRLARLALQRRK